MNKNSTSGIWIVMLIITLFIVNSGNAQPTLTAANSNPYSGDVYYNYYCDTSSISTGATGAGITWDYSYLTTSITDTTEVVTCSVTLYCDSFPGSTLVAFTRLDSSYGYYKAIPGNLELIGVYQPVILGGAGFTHFTLPQISGPFPVTYGSTWRDTIKYDFTLVHYSSVEINIADGYGTLKTPAGSYSNVLRVHKKTYITDTIISTGATSSDSADIYSWYQPGAHCPLLGISPTGTWLYGGNPLVSYSTSHSPEAVPELQNNHANFIIFPNPATQEITICNDQPFEPGSSAAIFDITGRLINTYSLSGTNTTTAVNNLAPGIYECRINAFGVGTESQKLIIMR